MGLGALCRFLFWAVRLVRALCINVEIVLLRQKKNFNKNSKKHLTFLLACAKIPIVAALLV